MHSYQVKSYSDASTTFIFHIRSFCIFCVRPQRFNTIHYVWASTYSTWLPINRKFSGWTLAARHAYNIGSSCLWLIIYIGYILYEYACAIFKCTHLFLVMKCRLFSSSDYFVSETKAFNHPLSPLSHLFCKYPTPDNYIPHA